MIIWVMVFSAIVGLIIDPVVGSRIETAELRMPDIQPNVKDLYLCTRMRVDADRPHFITGYTPHGSMMTAHHMLVYGCSVPGSDEEVWNCGEMSDSAGGFEKGPICAQASAEDTSRIIYAWARDAPELKLPEGVGFKVGGGSGINYLVLQVHYMHPMEGKDNSGVTIHSTSDMLDKQAGVLLIATGGGMVPHSEDNFDGYCKVADKIVMHPFAFRTHTHKHGTLVSGWRVRDNKWSLLGKKDPQLPQMFYEVPDKSVLIQQNDSVVARCHMVNNEDREVDIGSTSDDEMCNFYLMYWVQGSHDISQPTCYSPGPPYFHLEELSKLKNIPEEEMLKA